MYRRISKSYLPLEYGLVEFFNDKSELLCSFNAGKIIIVPHEVYLEVAHYIPVAKLNKCSEVEYLNQFEVPEVNTLKQELLNISGIGEKTALKILELSGNDRDEIINCLEAGLFEDDLQASTISKLKEHFME